MEPDELSIDSLLCALLCDQSWTDEHLLPQQMQLLERRVAALLWLAMNRRHPFPWGVSELAIDEQALAKGQVVVLACDVTFPDGTRIVTPGGATIEPAVIPSLGPDGDFVHLTVPQRRVGEPNIDLAKGEARRRWSRRPVVVHDEELGRDGLEASILLRSINARIEIGRPGPDDDSLRLPIFGLRAGPDGKPCIDDRGGWPPLTRIGAWPPLMQLLQEVAESLRLAEERLANARVHAVGTSAEHELRERLRQLRIHRDELARQLEWDGQHPREVFALFEKLRMALDLPASGNGAAAQRYVHTDPAGCFQSSCAALRDHLTVIDVVERSFRPGRAAEFELAWDPALAAASDEVWLQLPNWADANGAAGHVRFCAASELQRRREERDGGVPLTTVASKSVLGHQLHAVDPEDLASMPGDAVLALERRGGHATGEERSLHGARLLLRFRGADGVESPATGGQVA